MKNYTVIDTHCDTASELLDRNEQLKSNTCHVSLDKIKHYSSYIQFYAAWISKNEKNPLLRAIEILEKIKGEIEKNSEAISLIQKHSDLTAAIEAGKHGALLAIEDARALCGSLAALHAFFELGVRAITLTWNDDNEVADGAFSDRKIGLTPFGKEVVREMNRLHMMIDVSHISTKGFWDVLETSAAPVMASHSNAASLCRHPRNLDDHQIQAIIQNNGMVCVSVYPEFLSESSRAEIGTVIKHLDHILSLGGENNLGLGSDFDGIDCLPADMSHAGDYVKLFDEMRKQGYSSVLIDKITYKNMQNFMERIEK